MQTIRDVMSRINEACGSHPPERTEAEVRAYLQARGVRYEDAEPTIAEMFETGWIYGLDPEAA